MTKQFVSAARAAEIINYSERTIRRWIKKGLLPAEKDGDEANADYLIDIEDLERLHNALNMSEREMEIRLVAAEMHIRRLEEQVTFLRRELLDRPRWPEIWRYVERVLDQTYQPASGLTPGMAQPPLPGMPEPILRPLAPAFVRPASSALDAHDHQDAEELREPALPSGSMLVAHFARVHRVDRKTLLGQVENPRFKLSMTSIDRHARDGSLERWLTPEQQQRVIVYWDSAGKPYTACPDCPHDTISTTTETS
jgi:DNA-binding transcriptional MerR regulator